MIKKQRFNTMFGFFSVLILEVSIFLQLGRFNETMPFWNDNINLTLPYRVFLSNALNNGTYPFYDFFSGSGIPLLSVYSSSGLSPIVIGLALLFDYSSTVLIYELIFLNVISFAGMYLWAKKFSNETIALVAALSYALSTYFIFQSKANIEGMASAAAIPWICLGLLNVSRAKLIGSFQIAGACGLAFTHGYLGLNILVSVFVFLAMIFFGLSELKFKKSLSISDLLVRAKVPLLMAGLGILLFVGTILPLLTETARNFSRETYFEREFDPYTASMKFESWKTLFDPLVYRSAGPDEFGGMFANLFIPTPLLIGFFCLVLVARRFAIPAMLLFTVSYASIMPKNFEVTRYLVSSLPGFDLIRFHGWASIFVVFLCLTYGVIGLNRLLFTKMTFVHRLVFLLISISIMFIQFVTSVTQRYFYATLFLTLFTLLLIALAQSKVQVPPQVLAICLASLVVTSFAQMALADRRVGTVQPFEKALQTDIAKLAVAGQASWPIDSVKREGVFSVLGTYPNAPIANQHLYLNVPVVNSYTPSMNKRVLKATVSRGLEALEPFLVNQDFESLEYQTTFLNPNMIRFNILISEKTHAQIQIPYSKNFVAIVDGEFRELDKTSEDYMSVLLTKSDRELVLEYKPKFSWLQLIVVFISWFTIVLGAVYSHYKIPQSRFLNSSVRFR